MRGSPKKPRVLKPGNDRKREEEAYEYGYNQKASKDIGRGGKVEKDYNKPVAKDTNKTRRKIVKPTKKSTYA